MISVSVGAVRAVGRCASRSFCGAVAPGGERVVPSPALKCRIVVGVDRRGGASNFELTEPHYHASRNYLGRTMGITLGQEMPGEKPLAFTLGELTRDAALCDFYETFFGDRNSEQPFAFLYNDVLSVR